MLKQVLIAVTLVIVFNGLLVFSGALDRLRQTEEQVNAPSAVGADIRDVFYFTMTDEVDKKLGKPEEGYEPQMFLVVFPGLVETDFAGVEASIGSYQVTNGRIEHIMDNTKLVHGASAAVSRTGMASLLNNISIRTGIDLATDGTITDIMSVLTAD